MHQSKPGQAISTTTRPELPALPLMGIFDPDLRAVCPAEQIEAARTNVAQVQPVKRTLTADEIWELPLPALLGATGRAGLDLVELEPDDVPENLRNKFYGLLILPVVGNPFIAIRAGLNSGAYDLAIRSLIQRHVDDMSSGRQSAHMVTAAGAVSR